MTGDSVKKVPGVSKIKDTSGPLLRGTQIEQNSSGCKYIFFIFLLTHVTILDSAEKTRGTGSILRQDQALL